MSPVLDRTAQSTRASVLRRMVKFFWCFLLKSAKTCRNFTDLIYMQLQVFFFKMCLMYFIVYRLEQFAKVSSCQNIFVTLPPYPNHGICLSPKIWETRDQPEPGFFLQRRVSVKGKSLGTRLRWYMRNIPKVLWFNSQLRLF